MVGKAVDLVPNWSQIHHSISMIMLLLSSFIIHNRNHQRYPRTCQKVSPQQRIIHQFITSRKKYKICRKRRMLSNGNVNSVSISTEPDPVHCQLVDSTYIEIESLYQKYSALFEWADVRVICITIFILIFQTNLI